MVDKQTQLPKMLVGAVIGAGLAYLFLTKNGHRLLESAEPWLDDVIRDLHRLRGATEKVKEAFSEGRVSFAAVSEAIPLGHDKGGNWSEPHH